ncbi:D-amino-acid dehydrogenase [Angomonas deanei]|uniref:FAD dependent oxidoreductase, putative n=1 Tax=Angomonas deanei TaxID=59799 RepID=A0A7G2CUU3_9TRYP|nr:D-amino-acid dehydrogenase [Angomonas deanei]CAD2222183.1 FAD dependent oxidoreductase, putative [Angomonas deanei]|eukprot:EPY18578.1 D-amino-acid dehydrogenase [Angomonas deanei]
MLFSCSFYFPYFSQGFQTKMDDKPFSAVVLGAGMIGVCSAWYLQLKGHKVLLVDKTAPGEQASGGNAGCIQRECVLPYGFPSGLKTFVRMALNADISSMYQIPGVLQNWKALFYYWQNSQPGLYDKNAREFASLIEHCTKEHDVMIKSSKSDRLVSRKGYLELFRNKEIPEIESIGEHHRSAGASLKVLTPKDIEEMEPCLKKGTFKGGFHFDEVWTVSDPQALVQNYCDDFVRRGGTFVKSSVSGLTPPSGDNKNWSVQLTSGGQVSTPNVVVALGAWSGSFLSKLGYYFPLYPLRGYNTHLEMEKGTFLNHPICDVENGFVMCPMTDGLRVTTGGEVVTLDSPPTSTQVDTTVNLTKEMFNLGKRTTGVWYGHRPCMSDMKPVIGEAPNHKGLWLNFGHAHQGFTLGPVSGRLLSELITGEKTLVDPVPFSPNRF